MITHISLLLGYFAGVAVCSENIENIAKAVVKNVTDKAHETNMRAKLGEGLKYWKNIIYELPQNPNVHMLLEKYGLNEDELAVLETSSRLFGDTTIQIPIMSMYIIGDYLPDQGYKYLFGSLKADDQRYFAQVWDHAPLFRRIKPTSNQFRFYDPVGYGSIGYRSGPLPLNKQTIRFKLDEFKIRTAFMTRDSSTLFQHSQHGNSDYRYFSVKYMNSGKLKLEGDFGTKELSKNTIFQLSEHSLQIIDEGNTTEIPLTIYNGDVQRHQQEMQYVRAHPNEIRRTRAQPPHQEFAYFNPKCTWSLLE